MGNLDPGFWVDIVWKIWTAALTFYVMFSRSQKRLESKIDTLEHDLGNLSLKITRLDAHIQNAPSHAHLSDLHEKINGVAREMARFSEAQKQNENLLRAIHTTLIAQGNR